MKIKYIGQRNGRVNAKGTIFNVKKGEEYDLSEDICNHLLKTGLWQLVKEKNEEKIVKDDKNNEVEKKKVKRKIFNREEDE
ncbi:hypothetical protein DRN69_06690 [Candidatus Pacearchaeota archaeon]|nr:MAG: hypothetical protein DRN69_06690 [Candidatus Pacearchaeota archaeon]